MNTNASLLVPVDEIAERFSLSSLDVIGPLDKGGNVFVARSGGKNYALKRHWFLTEKRAPPLLRAYEALAGEGIIPPYLPQVNGGSLAKIGSDYYSLSALIEADKISVSRHIDAVAQITAVMHKVLAPLEVDGVTSPLSIGEDRLTQVFERRGREPLMDIILRASRASSQVRCQWAHNDLHADNFLVDKYGRAYILDLDSYSRNPLIGDVMFAAFRIGNGADEAIDRFIAVYNQYNRLTDSEKNNGIVFLAADFARKLGFIYDRLDHGDTTFQKDQKRYEGYVLHTQRQLSQI